MISKLSKKSFSRYHADFFASLFEDECIKKNIFNKKNFSIFTTVQTSSLLRFDSKIGDFTHKDHCFFIKADEEHACLVHVLNANSYIKNNLLEAEFFDSLEYFSVLNIRKNIKLIFGLDEKVRLKVKRSKCLMQFYDSCGVNTLLNLLYSASKVKNRSYVNEISHSVEENDLFDIFFQILKISKLFSICNTVFLYFKRFKIDIPKSASKFLALNLKKKFLARSIKKIIIKHISFK